MLKTGIHCALACGRYHGPSISTSGITRLAYACSCLQKKYVGSNVKITDLVCSYTLTMQCLNTSSTPADVPVRYRSSVAQETATSSAKPLKNTDVDPLPAPERLTAEEPTLVKPLTSREKLRAAIRDYGSTVFVFHVASGCTFLSMWYLIVSSSLIRTLGLEGRLSSVAGGATTFVVAYAIHKTTAPLRIGLTLTVAPLIVNYLRRKGILKVKAKI